MSNRLSRSTFLRIFWLFALLSLVVAVFATPTGLEPLGSRAVLDAREIEAEGGEGEDEAFSIGEYFQYRFEQMKDAKGAIPAGAQMTALTQRAAMARQRANSPQPDVAGIDNLSWTYAGPGNVGGRIRAILPIDASTVFIGGVSGGLWKTTNCCTTSTTWSPVSDFMANLAISTLIADPTNVNVLYAGTGEGFGNADAVRGAGIFKSTDGGVTWAQLASTNNSNWYYVNRLAISPSGAILLAATGSGIFRSTDGGASWTQLWSGRWLDVKFDPTDSTKAVASGSAQYTLYSLDGGSTWTQSTGLPVSNVRVELAYAPSNPAIVYAGVNQNSGEVWRSTDGGQTYSLVNTGTGYMSNQGWYNNTLWVSPANANQVVVAGLDIYQSLNGGATLAKISDWTRSWPDNPPSPHADHHALVSIPGSSTALLNGNDGGLYYTSDIATAGNNPPSYNNGWVYLNNNLGITQFYGVAGTASGILYGGSQDNGVTQYAPGAPNGWLKTNGGDGGKSAVDPINPGYYYNEYTFGAVNRSTGSGGSAEDIYGTYWNGSIWTCRAAPYRIDDACNGQGSFIAPILLDPSNPDRLFVGDLSLWVTNDARTPYVFNSPTGGPQWTALKPSIGSRINAIAVAPSDPNVIWVGYANNRIDVSTDGGTNWTQVNTNIGAGNPGTMVGSLAIDRHDSDIVYAGFTGFNAAGLYNLWRTTDGGATWTQVANNLPRVPIYAIAINPANSAWLYVGTEIGIFASVDTGATWNVPSGTGVNGDGPANVATFDLQWLGGGNSTGTSTLIAGTHGRGAFTAATISSPNTYADAVAHTCAGNSPCYDNIADALGTVGDGGTVTIYSGTYSETVIANRAMTVTVAGDVTLNEVYLLPGVTWNAGSSTITVDNLNLAAGAVWNANSSTLTVTGNLIDAPFAFVPGTGRVILGGATSSAQKPGVAVYSNDLSSMTGWLVVNPNGGQQWGFTTWTGTPNTNASNLHARSWPDTVAADDWLFSPGFTLQAGITYTVRFKYGTSSAARPEKIAVHLGQAQSVGAMTSQVFDNNNIVNVTWQDGIGTFKPSTTGTYYVGFHCYSSANMGYPAIDDLVVTATDANLNFYNLSVANGSTASLASSAVVQNDLLVTTGSTLTLSTAGVSVEGVVTNNGRLAQSKIISGTGVTFLNIKNAAGSQNKYWGAIITSTGNLSTTTVSVGGNQDCTSSPADPLIRRCFDITPTNAQPATIRFFYTYAELNGQTHNALRPWHWDSNWTQVGDTYTYAAACAIGQQDCWLEAQNISTFSPFGLGGTAPTAVALSGLRAQGAATSRGPWLVIVLGMMVALGGFGVWLRRGRAA